MRQVSRDIVRGVLFFAMAAALVAASPGVLAQEGSGGKTRLDLYGFAMLDMGYQSGQNDPDWFDVVRPTKLPSFENEFGEDGHFFAGVRQSRFGVKSFTPTGVGELKTIFEFELFGVNVDAGQTTFRLRHAWGELGQFGAGQTWSPFMDPDVFPNSIEYWGPSGMVFFRNVQFRWTPIQGDNTFMVALERPGASGDPGVAVGSPAFPNDAALQTRIRPRFPLPDLSARFRMTRPWGHFQVAGILREMKWDDSGPTSDAPSPLDFSGSATGWGVNLSSNLKFSDNTLRLQAVYGEGIQNYMNDATADVGLTLDSDIGEPLPILGLVAFYDCTWNDKWSTSLGYSMVDIDNSDGQERNAFAKGQYALVNLLYNPAPNVMLGPELQWGSRENNSDGFTVDDFRVQFSAKYAFNYSLGGK